MFRKGVLTNSILIKRGVLVRVIMKDNDWEMIKTRRGVRDDSTRRGYQRKRRVGIIETRNGLKVMCCDWEGKLVVPRRFGALGSRRDR